jgi:hypothetical protein
MKSFVLLMMIFASPAYAAVDCTQAARDRVNADLKSDPNFLVLNPVVGNTDFAFTDSQGNSYYYVPYSYNDTTQGEQCTWTAQVVTNGSCNVVDVKDKFRESCS